MIRNIGREWVNVSLLFTKSPIFNLIIKRIQLHIFGSLHIKAGCCQNWLSKGSC